MASFSKEFKTFEQWKEQAPDTPYTQRIIRGYYRRPEATLSQLRRHPGKEQVAISQVKKQPVYTIPVAVLTQREKLQRERSLQVLSKVRRGSSLSKAVKELKTSISTVVKNTGEFTKVGNRWKANPIDTIERIMVINTEGRQETIAVNNSATASIIGNYHNAVKDFFITGDKTVLKPFKGVIVTDADGKQWALETDPVNLRNIAMSLEDGEFTSIYVW